MSYIGTPPSNAFTSLLKQDFSTSATTGYTLDHAVNNANDIALFINFVRQEPTAGYAASGTSLVLTSATASSDDMYCVYLGQALQTVNPPNVSVGTAQLIDGAVTSAKLGTKNTPAFEAYLSSTTGVSNNVNTKVQCNTEVYDTNNAYDNSSNYRFQPQVAGKYFIYANLVGETSDYKLYFVNAKLYKNTTLVASTNNVIGTGAMYKTTESISSVVTLNGSSDYVEFYGIVDIHTNGNEKFVGDGSTALTYFGGYKIIE